MALKKPSDYFKKKEPLNSVDETVKQLIKEPELNTFSEAFQSFKSNLNKIEVLSEFSETLDNYRVNIERVNYLSEKVEDIQSEVQTLLKKEDLDRAMMSQLLIVEQSIRDIQDKVKGINEKNLIQIRSDVSDLTETVNDFIEVEVPKYKKLVVDSEIRTRSKYDKLEENVNQTLEDISQFVDNIKKEEISRYEKFIEETERKTESKIDQLNEKLDEAVDSIKNEEVSKYRKLIAKTEIKTESKINEFNEKLDQTVNDIYEKIDLVQTDKTSLTEDISKKIKQLENIREYIINDLKRSSSFRYDLNKKVTNLEVEIVRNETHLKIQNKNLEQIQEDVRSAIQKLDLEQFEKKNYELTKKIKYIEEIFEKFNEKEVLNEGILNEPLSTKNSDPLTPLNQNFVTLEQLQEHYRLFINRIQQQLSTLGGGGETRLRYLDDIVGIATNPAAYDGKFLRYNHSIQKFEFVDFGTNITLNQLGNVDDSNLSGISTNYFMVYDPATSGFKFVDPQIYFGLNSDFNPDPNIDDFGIYP